ncbi:DUF3077 domain-containing protein [Pseudomonas petrae]|uniref:DUF3077 domain-containing protein n=1 Tax=Pseudomonas petrae TaxID=2912190 RepID=UPI001EF085CC|nr:DUF3077 domain-containing protein [Pseudomonas petrae]MCF7532008.1 DUF3077 domain-containing protein [Pseudomonas petrae]MCF7557776.1 DUF3077 domain-containing protein [Pseudomonas petrae]
MSRPENTTGSPPAQHQMLTTAENFHPVSVCGVNQHLFQVNAGLAVEEAMNAAYALLDAAVELGSEGIHSGPSTNQTVAIRFLVQGAQALIGSSLCAVESGVSQ